MKINKKTILILSAFFLIISCSTKEKEEKTSKDTEKNLSILERPELKETAVQIKGLDGKGQIENETGILVVRFILDNNPSNVLDKLPNFRITGPRQLEFDNSPSNIRKDAVHIFVMPVGSYSISSVYAMNDKGEPMFDKPFPVNSFRVEKGKINYIGDIKVRLEEEKKGANLFTQKLKLKLPANNDETITIIQDKLKDFISKYPLERSIISF